MDLSLNVKTGIDDDRSWLGSAHGVNTMDPVTLNASTFVATFTDGRIPSGVAIAKITATGLYGPYNDALSNGQEVMAGHLGTRANVKGDDGNGAARNVSAPLFWHGEIVEANLPTSHGLDAAGKVDVGTRIRYV